MLTMTQFWMIGIIGLMVIFGICGGIFYHLGKKNEEN